MIALSDVVTVGTPKPNPVVCSVTLSGTANTGSASGPRARLENHRLVGGTRPSARRSAWSGFGDFWTTDWASSRRASEARTAVVLSPAPSADGPRSAASPLVPEVGVQAVTVNERRGGEEGRARTQRPGPASVGRR